MAGMRVLKGFLDKLEAINRVCSIAEIGGRKEENISMIGSIAAEMLDKIIIRQDKRLRGKIEEELIAMLEVDIKRQNQLLKQQ